MRGFLIPTSLVYAPRAADPRQRLGCLSRTTCRKTLSLNLTIRLSVTRLFQNLRGSLTKRSQCGNTIWRANTASFDAGEFGSEKVGELLSPRIDCDLD